MFVCLKNAFPEEGKWVSHHLGFCLKGLMVTASSRSILGTEQAVLLPQANLNTVPAEN